MSAIATNPPNSENTYLQSAQSTLNSITSTIYNHPATEKISNLATSTGEQIKDFVEKNLINDTEASASSTPGFQGPGAFPEIKNLPNPTESVVPDVEPQPKVTPGPQTLADLGDTPALFDGEKGYAIVESPIVPLAPQEKHANPIQQKRIPSGYGTGTDGTTVKDPAQSNPRAWAHTPKESSGEREYQTSWGETLKMGSGEHRGADTIKVHEIVGEVKPEDHEHGDGSNSSSESESDAEANSPKVGMGENIPNITADGDTTSSSEGENQATKKKPKFGKLKAKLKKIF